MTKIIILSASTGGGHNQAANSLASHFNARGTEVKIIDFLQIKGKTIERLFVGSYSLMYSNLPKVYSGLYSLTNNQLSINMSSFVLKAFESEIYRILIKENPQLIIATHPLIVHTICRLKEKKRIAVPFISVITDFKAHSFYLNSNVDAYITGSEYTRMDLIHKGIRQDKIFTYGLPIKPDFLSKKEVKRMNEGFTILLMGGSTGHSAMEDVLRRIICCRNALEIIMVCGTNKTLFTKIKHNYPSRIGNKKILVLGYTDKVSALMDEADLLISKPGGLTVSEAISKTLPMIIPFMLPGQEQENAVFLAETGCARVIDKVHTLHSEIDTLIDNPSYLLSMKQKIHDLTSGYCIDDIIALGEELMKQYSDNQLRRSGT